MRKWLLGFFAILACAILVYFLAQVFSGRLILPQTFSVGSLTIHYYGLIMALAVAVGFYVAIKRAPEFGIDEKTAEDWLFWTALAGFIGARLYHVLSSFSYYYLHPVDIFKVWNGGLSIYGAVFGGLIALWILTKLHASRFTLLTLLDWLTPSLILGQIIGRFGNLFNYEAFGYPTNLPWKMFVPLEFRPMGYLSYNFFHPFFLYEALGNLLILIFLMYLFGSRTSRPIEENQTSWPAVRDFAAAQSPADSKNFAGGGSLFIWYLLLYNILRFGLEFQRLDSTFVHGFRLNAGVSLLLVVCALVSMVYSRRRASQSNP